MPHTLPLTESQIMALERAACEHLEQTIPHGAGGHDLVRQCHRWVSNVLDWPHTTAESQTELSIAVTTLIGGD